MNANERNILYMLGASGMQAKKLLEEAGVEFTTIYGHDYDQVTLSIEGERGTHNGLSQIKTYVNSVNNAKLENVKA
jgi:RecB family endonuclease NucS